MDKNRTLNDVGWYSLSHSLPVVICDVYGPES
jgi:hypothetical protein